MTRGDQRDRDRAKKQAREAAKNGPVQREGTPNQRNDNDKVALQTKIAAKKAEKEAVAALTESTTKVPVPRKKPPQKAVDNFDDLLNVGLTKGKKGKK